MTPRTLPELEQLYQRARLAMIKSKADAGMRQVDAARELGITPQSLNEFLRRNSIVWPNVRQGKKISAPVFRSTRR